MMDMQNSDVVSTYENTDVLIDVINFKFAMPLREGMREFVP